MGVLLALFEVILAGMPGIPSLPLTPVILLLLCGEIVAKYGASALNKIEVWYSSGELDKGCTSLVGPVLALFISSQTLSARLQVLVGVSCSLIANIFMQVLLAVLIACNIAMDLEQLQRVQVFA